MDATRVVMKQGGRTNSRLTAQQPAIRARVSKPRHTLRKSCRCTRSTGFDARQGAPAVAVSKPAWCGLWHAAGSARVVEGHRRRRRWRWRRWRWRRRRRRCRSARLRNPRTRGGRPTSSCRLCAGPRCSGSPPCRTALRAQPASRGNAARSCRARPLLAGHQDSRALGLRLGPSLVLGLGLGLGLLRGRADLHARDLRRAGGSACLVIALLAEPAEQDPDAEADAGGERHRQHRACERRQRVELPIAHVDC